MKSGFLLIDKPSGRTSFSVDSAVKKLYDTKKVGHSGTLDPLASGLLLIGINKATGAFSILPETDKCYEVRMKLGIKTDSYDISGQVLSEQEPVRDLGLIESAVMSFNGGYDQIPPMYSARKKDGVRLYDLARKGKVVERKSSFVKLSIEDLLTDLPSLSFKVTCSRGTYIRSLVNDIGEKLGCGAVMTDLRRIKCDGFDLSQAYKIDDLFAMTEEEREEKLIKIDSLFMDYPALHVKEGKDRFLLNGNALDRTDFLENEIYPGISRIYQSNGLFAALYRKEDDILKPCKMFIQE